MVRHCSSRWIRSTPFWLSLVPVLLVERQADAATVVPGGNLVNQTWTVAGSPYLVQGDVIVPNGVTLTIEAGTLVQFASSDALAANNDTSRVELIVRGTLNVNGVASSPVYFQSQAGTTAGLWYGLVVDGTASWVALTHAIVQHAVRGVDVRAAGPVFQATDTTVQNDTYGFYLENGASFLTRVTASANTYGIYETTTGSATISGGLIYGNSNSGVSVASSSGTTSIVDSTIHGNANGVYVGSASAVAVTLTNSIVTENGNCGLYRIPTGAAVVSVSYSDVWGNAIDYSDVSAGTGAFSANPLYVAAPDNLRLTSNSPARFASETQSDIGALPYVDDATPGLYGVLWTDTQLGAANSPYSVPGDLTVAPGITLALEPGVELVFDSGDLMRANSDVSRSELIVRGRLVTAGTGASPVRFFGATASTPVWWGIDFSPSAHGCSLVNAIVERSTYGISYRSTATDNVFSGLTFRYNSYGFSASAGTPRLDLITANNNGYGFYSTGTSSLTVSNALVYRNNVDGFYLNSTGTTSIVHATVADNEYGIYATGTSGGAVTVVNSIIALNDMYGVDRSGSTSGTVSVAYSDFWQNWTNYASGVSTSGCLSQDPSFVNYLSGDFRLQAWSAVIDKGTATGAPNHDLVGTRRPLGAGYDMGAYEYDPAAAGGTAGGGGTGGAPIYPTGGMRPTGGSSLGGRASGGRASTGGISTTGGTTTTGGLASSGGTSTTGGTLATGGTSMAEGGAGTPTSGGVVSGGGEGGAGTPPVDGGCTCRAARTRRTSRLGLLLVAFVALLRRRRRD